MSTERTDRSPIHPEGLGAPKTPVSWGIVSGGFLFVSGQMPLDSEWRLVSDDFRTQARATFDNFRACLHAAGCDFRDVVKVTAFLANTSDFDAYNEIYGEYFEPPYPARTTVQAGLLGFSIEVEGIARLPGRR